MNVKRCRDLMTYSIRNESFLRYTKLRKVNKPLSLHNYICTVYMQEPLRPEDSTGFRWNWSVRQL